MHGWDQETEPSAFPPSPVTQAVLRPGFLLFPFPGLPLSHLPNSRPNLMITLLCIPMFVIVWPQEPKAQARQYLGPIPSLSKDDDLLCTAVAAVSWGTCARLGVPSQTQWPTPVMSSLGRLRQEECLQYQPARTTWPNSVFTKNNRKLASAGVVAPRVHGEQI